MADFVDTLTIKARTEGVDQAKASVDQLGRAYSETERRVTTTSQSLDRLQRAIDPVYAAQQRLVAINTTLQRNVDAGTLSYDRAAQLMAQATSRYGAAAGASEKLAAATRLTYTELEILRSGMINTVQSLAAGMGAARTLETQFFQVLPAIGGVARAMGGPMVAAVGAATVAIGALVAGMASGVARAIEIETQIRKLGTTIQGMGNVAGVTAGQARDVAQSLFVQGASRGDAVATVQSILSNRNVRGDMVGRVAGMSLDLSAASGMSQADATKSLIAIVDQGYPAIQKLNEAMGFLNATQLVSIREMYEHGQRAEGASKALAALQDRISGLYQQSLSPTEKALHELSVAWSGFVDAIAASKPVLDGIKFLRENLEIVTRVVSGGRSPWNDGVVEASPGPNTMVVGQGGGARMAAIIAQGGPNPDLAPGTFFANGVPTPGAVAGKGGGSGGVGGNAEGYSKSREALLSLTKQNDELAKAMRLVGVAREVEMARIAAQTEIVNKKVDAEEASAYVEQKEREVLLRNAGAIAEVTAQTTRSTDETIRVGAAYLKSEGAGIEAEARRQASLESLRSGIDLTARSQQLLNEKLSQAAAVSAQGIAPLERQARAQREIATAAADGYAAQHEAELRVRIDEATHADRVLADLAASKGQLAVEAQLREAIERKAAAIRAADQATTDLSGATALRTSREQLQVMQAQYDLVGQLPSARAEELAKLQAILQLERDRIPLDSAAGQEIVANAQKMARLGSAAQEIDAVTTRIGDNFSRSLVEGGQTGFDALKQIAKSTIAEIASALIFRPLIQPVVAGVLGSFYGTGGGGAGGFLGGVGSTVGRWFGGGSADGGGGGASGGGGGGGGLGGFNLPFGSLFSGDGLFSRSSIDAFGASTGLFGSGAPTQGLTESAAAAAEAQGLAPSAFNAAGASNAGLLGSTTLSSALPYIGVGIGALTQLASGRVAGGLGTLGGAAIGSIFGPVGMGIGAFAGGLLGNLFGGGGPKPGGDTFLGISGGRLGLGAYANVAGGGGPTQEMAGTFVGRANALMDQYGLTVDDASHPMSSFGYASKYKAYYGIDPARRSFGSAEEAIRDSERYLIENRMLSATAGGSIGTAQSTVLGRTAAKTFEDLAKELQAATEAALRYDAAMAATGKTLTQVEQQEAQRRAELAKQRDEARQYGLGVEALRSRQAMAFGQGLADQLAQIADPIAAQLDQVERDAAARRQTLDELGAGGASGILDDLNARLKRQAGQQLLGIDPADMLKQLTMDPLQYALDKESETAAERVDIAQKFGLDVVQIEALNAAERKKIIEDGNASIVSSMKSLVQQLDYGNLSAASPAAQIAAAKADYEKTRDAALRGDRTALGNFSGAASSYLDLARSYYSTTQPYVDAYTEVSGLAKRFADPANLPGFAGGGSFTVGGSGGVDSQLVAFRASPWETVTVGGAANDDVAAAVMGSSRQLWVAVQSMQATLAQLQSAGNDATGAVADGVERLNGNITALLNLVKQRPAVA